MKRSISLALAALVAVAIAGSPKALSEDPGHSGQPSAAEMAEMMAIWQAVATPAEHHKKLDRFVGEWDLAIRTWMGGPGTPAAETKGTASVKWVLGGRYIMDETSSYFLMPGPDGNMEKVPFNGIGFTGYDNFRKMYVSAWVDNMSTQLFTSTGSWNDKGDTLTFFGQMDEPVLGVHGYMAKYVTRVIDHDHHVFEMFDLRTGEETLVMEITYTRKQ